MMMGAGRDSTSISDEGHRGGEWRKTDAIWPPVLLQVYASQERRGFYTSLSRAEQYLFAPACEII